MCKKRYFIFIVLLWVSLFIDAQVNYQVISEDTYDSGALYGYMNGGSELYLEYGFQSLTVKELDIGGETLTYQVYTMLDEKMAYGIFSINVFKCGECTVNDQFKCCNTYQLQSVIGSKYLSIINTTGSSKAQKAAQKLYEKELKIGANKNFSFPEIINLLEPKTIFAVNGQLAIENRLAYWEEAYRIIKPGFCYMLKWGSANLSAMVFKSDLQSQEFALSEEGILYKYKKKGDYTVILRFSDEKSEEVYKLLDLL